MKKIKKIIASATAAILAGTSLLSSMTITNALDEDTNITQSDIEEMTKDMYTLDELFAMSDKEFLQLGANVELNDNNYVCYNVNALKCFINFYDTVYKYDDGLSGILECSFNDENDSSYEKGKTEALLKYVLGDSEKYEIYSPSFDKTKSDDGIYYGWEPYITIVFPDFDLPKEIELANGNKVENFRLNDSSIMRFAKCLYCVRQVADGFVDRSIGIMREPSIPPTESNLVTTVSSTKPAETTSTNSTTKSKVTTGTEKSLTTTTNTITITDLNVIEKGIKDFMEKNEIHSRCGFTSDLKKVYVDYFYDKSKTEIEKFINEKDYDPRLIVFNCATEDGSYEATNKINDFAQKNDLDVCAISVTRVDDKAQKLIGETHIFFYEENKDVKSIIEAFVNENIYDPNIVVYDEYKSESDTDKITNIFEIKRMISDYIKENDLRDRIFFDYTSSQSVPKVVVEIMDYWSGVDKNIDTEKAIRKFVEEKNINENSVEYSILELAPDPVVTTTSPVNTTPLGTTSTTVATTVSATKSSETTATKASTTEPKVTIGTEKSSTTATESSGTAVTTTETNVPKVVSGDANDDNSLSVQDCVFIAKALANRKGDTLPESADYNKDGKKNVIDAMEIAKDLAKDKNK